MPEPLTLLIDTSAASVTALFNCQGECLSTSYEREKPAGELAESLQAQLQEHSAAFGDIEKVLVANGPGSFTGLRVGIAFAQGLCFPGGLPLYPFSSLLPGCLALEEIGKGGVIIPAKRGFYYLASNAPKSPAFEREILISTHDLLAGAEFMPNLIASDPILDQSVLENACPNMVSLERVYPYTRVYACVKKMNPAEGGIVGVNYIQKPAAEAKRLGLTD